MIYGTNNSTNGPHTQTFTDSDNYPLLQTLSWGHDDIKLGFDTYYDGTNYKSSDVGSNFVLSKKNDKLEVLYGSGTSQGSNVTLATATSIDNKGDFTCNGLTCLSVSPTSVVGLSMINNGGLYANNTGGTSELCFIGRANAPYSNASIIQYGSGGLIARNMSSTPTLQIDNSTSDVKVMQGNLKVEFATSGLQQRLSITSLGVADGPLNIDVILVAGGEDL